jgi:hypothetical protein
VNTLTTARPYLPSSRAWLSKAAAASFALACLNPAQANWMTPTSDNLVTTTSNVELTFIAWDNNGSEPKVAFIKDLGVTMADFSVQGQKDVATQMYWYLGGTDDAAWATFLNTDVSTGVKPDASKIRWAVFALAGQDLGSSEPDSVQLYTTNLQGLSGNPATIPGWSNFTNGNITDISAAFVQVYSSNQNSGTLGSATNGSAVVLATDGLKFPWNPGVLFGFGNQITYKQQFSRGVGNLIGQSSWFYKLTGSDIFDSSLPVTIDEFDNLTNDGYWGLAAASATDRAGQYFLSYNLNGTVSALEAKSGTLASNNFARLAGVLSLSSSAGKGQTVLNMTESFLRGFSKVAASLPSAAGDDLAHALAGDGALDLPSPSAVPEVGSAALTGAGLAVLAGLQLRRRRAHARR